MIKLKFLVVFTFALLFYSCQFTDSGVFQYNVGNDFVKDPVIVTMIDTLSVNIYTTVSDTVATSLNNRFMAGRFENSYGIVTTCESYFRFDPIVGQTMKPSSVFDSVCLILNLDGYHYGDTSKVCKMEFFRLTEDIEVDDETRRIYNTTQFAHEISPLETFSIDLREKALNPLSIRLPDEFGQELFDLVYNKSDTLDDADLFKLIYKGFLIKPSDDNISNVVGFVANPDSVTSPRIKIYYHDNSIDDDLSFSYEIEKHEITSSNGSVNVNYYASNYFDNNYSKFITGTLPSSTGKLSSVETDNVVFLQGGFNLKTRIEIPGIDKLHYLGIGSVIKAELLFEPVSDTYKNIYDLPSNLEMYLTDNKNRDKGQLGMVGSEDMTYAILHYNKEFKNETYYSIDITKFVVDEYMSVADPVYSLLMTMPKTNVNSNVNQLIIGDQNHPTNKMKLKVYMATY